MRYLQGFCIVVVGGVLLAAGRPLAAACADTDGDGNVGVPDLVHVITAWGTSDRAADVNTDGIVDVGDLIEVVSGWGVCPTAACCLPDGLCLAMTEGECLGAGGTYAGDRVECAVALCFASCPAAACGPGEFCWRPLGQCTGAGTCLPRPEVCLALWAPVCGCDGQTYSNDCVAHANGVNVAHDGPCGR